MDKRVIAFIIATVLAIFLSYAQETQESLPQSNQEELTVPTPPIMEEPPRIAIQEESTPAQQKETASDNTAQEASVEPSQIEEQEVSTADQLKEVEPQKNGIERTQEPIPLPNNINIGLSAQVRQKVATLLNKLLSDEFVLYTKTLKFHWNVQGPMFHDYHQMFKEQYEQLFDFVDSIAERARTIGAPALGTLQEFSVHTQLKEIKTDKLSALEMIKQLQNDHETIIRTIRNNIDAITELNDQGTSNFLQEILLKHEKIAWMLRATQQ